MKKLIKIGVVCAIGVLVTLGVSSFKAPEKETAKAVEIEGFWYSWEDGLKKAKKENKMILVDVYTTWCGWCTKMENDTYAKDNIQKLINDNFVPIKINPEEVTTYTIGAKTYTGKEMTKFLASGKNYNSYPITYFWVDPENGNDGDRKYLQQGYLTPTQMTQVLNRIVKIKGN